MQTTRKMLVRMSQLRITSFRRGLMVLKSCAAPSIAKIPLSRIVIRLLENAENCFYLSWHNLRRRPRKTTRVRLLLVRATLYCAVAERDVTLVTGRYSCCYLQRIALSGLPRKNASLLEVQVLCGDGHAGVIRGWDNLSSHRALCCWF